VSVGLGEHAGLRMACVCGAWAAAGTVVRVRVRARVSVPGLGGCWDGAHDGSEHVAQHTLHPAARLAVERVHIPGMAGGVPR
jgi:hypothetical protein